MIQLATDPTAIRVSYRPEHGQAAAKQTSLDVRPRTGHAWPFLSRYTPRPAGEGTQKASGTGS